MMKSSCPAWALSLSAATAVVLFLSLPSTESQAVVDEFGYRLEPPPMYMIVAPSRVYPDMVVQVSVTIFQLYQSHLNVRASIRQGGEEYASFFTTFTEPSTRLLQMRMLDTAQPGNYTMRVEGTMNGGQGGNVFENETDIMFSIKRVSMFITLSKPIYCQEQYVRFRVVPVLPNLLPAHGAMDVYIIDATGTEVKWWNAQQPNAGNFLDLVFQLSDQPAYGTWTIRVDGFGDTYEKNFTVEQFFLPRMYVNVSMPNYVMQDTYGITGFISANHTSGRGVKGNGKLRMEVRPPLLTLDPNRTYEFPYIEREISFFEGRTTFSFTMHQIKQLLGTDPVDVEIHVNATIFDWYLLQNQTGSAVCVIKNSLITMKLLGDHARVFIPGFPVSLYYAVMHSDGTPLHSDRRQVSISVFTRLTNGRTSSIDEMKLIVRDDGMVHYEFLAAENAEFIRITAFYDTDNSGEQRVETVLSRRYSHRDNYIGVTTSTEAPYVNEYMIFTVRVNEIVSRVYYMIVAGGNIIVANQLEMQGMQKTFSVALSRDMVPSARIVAYYMHQGEIVADSLNFFVNGTRQNPVNVRINMGKDFSRDTVEVTGITDPGGYIAFNGIDYDLYSRGGNVFLTEEKIIEELETYDSHSNLSFTHTWYYGEDKYQKVYFPAPSYGIDSNTTFSYSGLIVFTDANVTRIHHLCNETQGFLPCYDGVCFEESQRCDGTMQCEDGADEMGCPERKEVDPFTPPIDRLKHITRYYMETGEWLWKSHFVKPDGRIDLPSQVPKEPMSWVIGAFAMSSDTGLGVVIEPTRHQSSRPFYIQVEMPDLVVKGEQIGVRVAVFNYWGVDLECLVLLHDSDDYRFVLVESMGIVSSYKPRTTRGNVQTMVYVPSNRMATVHFPVLPVRDGEVEVAISAESMMGIDTVYRKVQIKYDGVTNYYHTPYFLDLIRSGSQIIPDFQINVTERFYLPGQREHLYVPGSADCDVAMVGDVVGPGFFAEDLTAEKVMRKPYGSADGNLFNYAYNLYNLKFLKQTNQLDSRTMKSALGFMNLALQRQLSYMNPDGSFSMFRDYRKQTPSVWVTAFALETLSNSNEADWTLELFISSDLLNKISLYLCSVQLESGAFTEFSPLYDRKLLVNGEDPHNISMTAHVLVALATVDTLTGRAQTEVETAKTNAARYLSELTRELEDPLQTALVTYALYLANGAGRQDAFTRMQRMRREGVYWSRVPIPNNPTRIVNTIPYLYPRELYPHEGSAVQATAYGLLVYLNQNYFLAATPAMEWLQNMRNSIGGFAATRDSVVALQALVKYGEGDTNRDLYNVRILMEATATKGSSRKFDFNRQNWAKTKYFRVPDENIWGQVKSAAEGTGMVLFQMMTQKNVEYASLLDPKPNGTFYDVTLDRKYFHGKNFSIFDARLCAEWKRPDIYQRTGLTVLEAHLPTGYVIVNDVLRRYVQSHEVPNLSRAEFYDRKVVFYFDYLEANEKTCVSFRADRWYPVANATIQHLLYVYNFFEPGMFNRSLYTTYELFNLHICQVCGSFQCPYCPFYNTAAEGVARNSVLALLSIALVFIIQHLNLKT